MVELKYYLTGQLIHGSVCREFSTAAPPNYSLPPPPPPFPFWVSPSYSPQKNPPLSFHALTGTPFCNPFFFHIHAVMGGWYTHFPDLSVQNVQRSSDLSLFLSYSCALFGTIKNSTHLFSGDCALFTQNTRGGGIAAYPNANLTVHPISQWREPVRKMSLPFQPSTVDCQPLQCSLPRNTGHGIVLRGEEHTFAS